MLPRRSGGPKAVQMCQKCGSKAHPKALWSSGRMLTRRLAARQQASLAKNAKLVLSYTRCKPPAKPLPPSLANLLLTFARVRPWHRLLQEPVQLAGRRVLQAGQQVRGGVERQARGAGPQ